MTLSNLNNAYVFKNTYEDDRDIFLQIVENRDLQCGCAASTATRPS